MNATQSMINHYKVYAAGTGYPWRWDNEVMHAEYSLLLLSPSALVRTLAPQASIEHMPTKSSIVPDWPACNVPFAGDTSEHWHGSGTHVCNWSMWTCTRNIRKHDTSPTDCIFGFADVRLGLFCWALAGCCQVSWACHPQISLAGPQ